MNIPNGKECYITPRKFFTGHNRELTSDELAYSKLRYVAKISQAKVNKQVTTNGGMVAKSSSLTGIVSLNQNVHILETNDRIDFKGQTYIIQTISIIETQMNLNGFAKYQIEAIA